MFETAVRQTLLRLGIGDSEFWKSDRFQIWCERRHSQLRAIISVMGLWKMKLENGVQYATLFKRNVIGMGADDKMSPHAGAWFRHICVYTDVPPPTVFLQEQRLVGV